VALISVKGGPQELQKSVLSQDLCSACGACTSICPYIDMVKGKGAVIIENCGLKEGKCFDFCPRTFMDVAFLDVHVFGKHRSDVALGSYISIMKARAKDNEVRSSAQYGGVASALAIFALENGILDAFILANSKDGICAKPMIAKNRSDVLKCARSKYVVCPMVEGAIQTINHKNGKVGFVGTPCQTVAIRKMQASKLENSAHKVKLFIGLFCTWALNPEAKTFLLNKVGSSKILKLDIPPPPANVFIVQTEREKHQFPLDDLRRFIMPSCNVCFDMTNEFADISVGMVEGEEGWNTVIVRTDEGEKILQKAINDEIIETRPLEKERLDHLREASLTRKKRVLTEMPPEEVAYLLLNEEDKMKIIKGG
jgi:coenzyme F420 hydrogenase subunit beta